MRRRLNTIGGAAGAIAALALGGSAIASATQHTASAGKHAHSLTQAQEPTGGADSDNVQSGDTSSPDVTGPSAASRGSAQSSASETSTAAGETGSQGETAAQSDGPGGHEDPEGNVDHQGEGEE